MTKQNAERLCEMCYLTQCLILSDEENDIYDADFPCNHDELIESVKEQIEKNEQTIKYHVYEMAFFYT